MNTHHLPQMATSAMKSQRAVKGPTNVRAKSYYYYTSDANFPLIFRLEQERTGARRAIFGVRPNEAFYEEKREIGLKKITKFPFTGAEK